MTRRLRLAVAVAVGVSISHPGSASAASGMEIGVQDDPVLVSGAYYDRERALRQARDMGATRVRATMIWGSVVQNGRNDPEAPAQLVYDWRPFDELIDAAARHGMRVQLTLTGPAPAFATYNRRRGNYGPRPNEYGAFVRAAARHFKGRVDRYSVWNEPNFVSWMAPAERAPALYRQLYKVAYTEIKRVDRGALVLIGETSPFSSAGRSVPPLAFLRDVTCAEGRGTRLRRGLCKPLVADGYAHHPYDYRHRPGHKYRGRDNVTLGVLSRLTGTLRALDRIGALSTPRGRRLPVYLTEYGYFNDGAKYALGERVRSGYLRQAFAMARRNPEVRQMTQFGLVTAPFDFPGSYFDMSIIGADGTPTPSYYALRDWAASAQVKRPGGPIALPPAP